MRVDGPAAGSVRVHSDGYARPVLLPAPGSGAPPPPVADVLAVAVEVPSQLARDLAGWYAAVAALGLAVLVLTAVARAWRRRR